MIISKFKTNKIKNMDRNQIKSRNAPGLLKLIWEN